MSLAAAMTLGYKPGLFYRDARLYCINLLLTYPEGCGARCAYCGLSAERPKTDEGKSFIRVQWPTFPAAVQVTPAAYQAHPSAVLTVCNVERAPQRHPAAQVLPAVRARHWRGKETRRQSPAPSGSLVSAR
jgi:biotin synthase